MDKIVVIIIGALGGIGQFLILQHSLKFIVERKSPQIARVLLWKIPIPLVLLLGCAFINANLLPYAGGSFCLSLAAASVVSHFAKQKRKE